MMKERFLNLGIINNEILNLTPKEAYRNCIENKAILIDIREEYLNAFKQFNVPECILCPMSEIIRLGIKLPKDRIMIIADSAGIKSKEAILYLNEKGFENIANMPGGIVEWERSKLPLLIDNTNRLSGSCMCQLKFRNSKHT